MASSSNSEWAEHETLFSQLYGGEQKQTVLGQGGIGRTSVTNSNSNIEFRYEVQINNYYGDRRRIDVFLPVQRKCEAFKMDLLTKDEAWSLFLHHVGHEALHVKDLEPIAKGVALECARRMRLPPSEAVWQVKQKLLSCDWRDALKILKSFSKEPGDERRRVIEQLNFSFDGVERGELGDKFKFSCALECVCSCGFM